MKVSIIDGIALKGMMESAASWLYRQKDAVDALNVFPVPDGDTGSNMYMTLAAAAREAEKVEGASVAKVAASAAMGALMGARGNSGVILSQFFRGMSRSLEGLETATASDVAKACTEAAATAYKAVMRPVEGTILTVGREAAKAGANAARNTDDIVAVLSAVVEEGYKTLARTPEMLPALKEAGVVDAGGKGLLVALEGAIRHLERMQEGIRAQSGALTQQPGTPPAGAGEAARAAERTGIRETDSIEYQYCTEFLLRGNDLSEGGIRSDLEGYGDSLLVVGTPDMVRIHIHTNNPGLVLEYAVKLGTLSEVQINNMVEQNLRAAALNEGNATSSASEPRRADKIGIVAVAVGDGISDVFKSLGVDAVLAGGQSMNPSIEEIKSAVEGIGASQVVILPNNSNVILTAQQVTSLTDVTVKVIPTKTIPQGISAMLAYSESDNLAQTAAAMAKAAMSVRTGEVTYAVRNSRYNGLDIAEGDYIGLDEDEVVVTGPDLVDVVMSLLERITTDESSLITLFYGHDVTADAAADIAERVRQAHPDVEVEVQRGGQPLYYFIIAVE